MLLVQYDIDSDNKELARKICDLENTVWTSESNGKDAFPQARHTYITSFVFLDKDLNTDTARAISHVAIRHSKLEHKGIIYRAYGLSEVVTDKEHRGKGLATALIQKAVAFITDAKADIIIFTCAKDKRAFYTKCGFKQILCACFVGGTHTKPFRSDSLDLVTMMGFISDKAKAHTKDFENTDIVCELGEGELW